MPKCFFIPQFSRFAELTYLCCYPLSLLSFYPSVSIRAIRGLFFYLTDNVVLCCSGCFFFSSSYPYYGKKSRVIPPFLPLDIAQEIMFFAVISG